MKNMSISKALKPIGSIIRKYHLSLFIILVAGLLILAILTLDSLLRPSVIDDGSTSNPTSFDDATIKKLDGLKKSVENRGNQPLPSGRINPFSS